MRKRVILAALLAAGLAGSAHAQAVREPSAGPYPHFGLQGSVGENVNLGVGVRYENRMTGMFPAMPNLRFAASFDYFFPDSPARYWEINTNVFDLLTVHNARVVPYVGGGLNIAHSNGGGGNSDVGLNVLGGLRLPGRYRPYLEARIELGGGDRFVATLGWLLW